MINLKTFFVVLLTFIFFGCAQQGGAPDVSHPKVGETKAMSHDETQCPQNIEGLYEAPESEDKVTIEFSRNSEGVLYLLSKTEESASEAVAIPVNGKVVNADGMKVSCGCQKSRIKVVAEENHIRSEINYIPSNGSIKMEMSVFEGAHLERIIRSFKKIAEVRAYKVTMMDQSVVLKGAWAEDRGGKLYLHITEKPISCRDTALDLARLGARVSAYLPYQAGQYFRTTNDITTLVVEFADSNGNLMRPSHAQATVKLLPGDWVEVTLEVDEAFEERNAVDQKIRVPICKKG